MHMNVNARTFDQFETSELCGSVGRASDNNTELTGSNPVEVRKWQIQWMARRNDVHNPLCLYIVSF